MPEDRRAAVVRGTGAPHAAVPPACRVTPSRWHRAGRCVRSLPPRWASGALPGGRRTCGGHAPSKQPPGYGHLHRGDGSQHSRRPGGCRGRREVFPWRLALPVRRVSEPDGCGRCLTGWPVVAHESPQSAGLGLTNVGSKHRDRRVIGVQLGCRIRRDRGRDRPVD